MDEQSEYTARACAFPSDHCFFFIHPLRPLMEKQLSALTNCLYQPLRFKDWLSHHAAVRNQQPPTGNISRCAAWIRMLLVDWIYFLRITDIYDLARHNLQSLHSFDSSTAEEPLLFEICIKSNIVQMVW